MKRKMLLTAVGNYNGRAPELKAAVPELMRWKDLLSRAPYEMEIVWKEPLANEKATRQAILDGLETLVAGAEPGDQVLWVFIGHGTKLHGQQAIVAYPGDEFDLRKAAVRYDDVARILKGVHSAVDITIQLECCFAGAFRGDKPGLFVSLDADLDLLKGRALRKFSDLATRRVKREDNMGGLVVVSASRNDEVIFPTTIGGVDRLWFSYKAMEHLAAERASFNELIQAINPLSEDPQQNAVVYGSDDRTNEKFPGEAASGTETVRVRGGGTNVRNTASIEVRFLGLGCFIPAEGGPALGTRVVLPYDDYAPEGSYDHHFGFVEIAVKDMDGDPTGLYPYDKQYTRQGVLYKRWRLTQHTMYVYDAAAAPFTSSQAFRDHVPAVPDFCPTAVGPRRECYNAYPTAGLFTGFLDFKSGSVDIGDLDTEDTIFNEAVGGKKTWGPKKTPRFVTITLDYKNQRPAIVLSAPDDTLNTQIFLHPGAKIMAGCARETDITGDGAGYPNSQHFGIYYKLASSVKSPAFPRVPSVPVDACSPIKWP
jgi:hypothetical protein